MILYCLYYGNSHPQKEETFFCRKKKASRFIDIREASCIRKMTCRANSAGKLSGEDKGKLKLLKERGEWKKGQSPLGLPKTKHEA